LHERERMEALLTIAAVLIVAAGLALMVWVVPLTSSEVGTEDAPRKAVTGSAVVPTFSLGRV
jgi:cytosine/uracil/thiamine/allantoin permease